MEALEEDRDMGARGTGIISGKTKVYGIMACPVEHSLSPWMHQFFARKTGVDMAYVPFLVPEGQLGQALAGAYAMNLAGLNISVPHKQQVMGHLAQVEEAAIAIGAVNTLVRIEGGYKGYNTDWKGLLRALEESSMQVRGAACLLIGAGGAARAAAYVLAREGARRVYVLNRSQEKARELALEMNQRMGREAAVALSFQDYCQLPEDSYLAIQATSLGMAPREGQAPIQDPGFYRRIHGAMDLVYNPGETAFMKLVAQAGGKAKNGLDMLLYQGLLAFELWNQEAKVTAQVAAEAREGLKKQMEARA